MANVVFALPAPEHGPSDRLVLGARFAFERRPRRHEGLESVLRAAGEEPRVRLLQGTVDVRRVDWVVSGLVLVLVVVSVLDCVCALRDCCSLRYFFSFCTGALPMAGV